MAQFPNMPLWTDADDIVRGLVSDGWFSPDTYRAPYRQPSDIPAVYLFLVRRAEVDRMGAGFVGYVGMSEALPRRWRGHEILAALDRPGYWPQRWFKPVAVDDLRSVEARWIAAFNPPWNILGRRRGVVLA